MNPDYHDPKNHVPPVAAGDDWGDLDRVFEKPQIGLPPRRPDRGIPTKRELNGVTAKRHAPHPKLYEDETIPLIEPISVGDEASRIPATKAARKAAKKIAKKASKTATKRSAKKQASEKMGKIVVDAPQNPIEAAESEANHRSGLESETDEEEIPISITVERGSKRFRVNEISPQRPVEKRIQKTPLTISKTTGKWASNDALMQNGNIQSSEAISSGVTNVRATLVWIICAGAAVILIVVGAILLSRPPKVSSETKKRSVVSDLNPDKTQKESESVGRKSNDTLINGEDQAKKIFAKYATSKSVEDFIEMIYRPEKNRDLISKNWEPMGLGAGWKPEGNCTWTVTGNGGTQYGILAGALANFSGFSAVFRQEGDSIKMDWRATNGHSSVDYSVLKQGQGDADEIRAILSLGDFHTFTMPENEFRCYRLTAPDREENIWAYTKINGANDVKLSSQFIPSQLTGEAVREIPVVIMLVRGPTQSLPNQWIISNVVRLNWLDE